jgi:branched-chain amino acid transport system substrate-binding protein
MKALKRRTFLKGIGLAVGTMTLSGVLRGPAILAQPPVVTIGTLLDSTGPLAEFGPALRKGADLAAKHLNEAAQAVLGGPIVKLVHEDPGFPNFAQVVDRAKKLVTVDKAVGLVGGLASSASLAIAREVSKPFKVPQLSPASTSPLLTVEPDDDFLFRTTASDALQGVVLAMLAAGEIKEAPVKFKTAATLYVNNPYGQGPERSLCQVVREARREGAGRGAPRRGGPAQLRRRAAQGLGGEARGARGHQLSRPCPTST